MGQVGLWILLTGLFVLVWPFFYFSGLVRRGRIGGLYVPDRTQRCGPFVGMIGLYVTGFLVLKLVHAPHTMVAALVIYIINLIVMTAVTLLWKISFHAMGAAISVVILMGGYGLSAWPALGLIPLVGWARVRTGAHTIRQVIAGALLGGGMAGLLWRAFS